MITTQKSDQINSRFSPEIRSDLELLSAKSGQTMSDIIRTCVENFLPIMFDRLAAGEFIFPPIHKTTTGVVAEVDGRNVEIENRKYIEDQEKKRGLQMEALARRNLVKTKMLTRKILEVYADLAETSAGIVETLRDVLEEIETTNE